MKQILLIPSLLLAAALLLGSCVGKEPEGCEDVVTVHLKDLDKYVPYTGTETLRFLHNSTDTQTFIGQGMERFFVRSYPGSPQEGCKEDHESIRVRFKSIQNENEIRIEYVFDEGKFAGYIGSNKKTFFKMYFKGSDLGEAKAIAYSNPKIQINGNDYSTYGLFVFSNALDTTSYIMYRRSIDGNPSGILKIKYPNDTLTLLR